MHNTTNNTVSTFVTTLKGHLRRGIIPGDQTRQDSSAKNPTHDRLAPSPRNRARPNAIPGSDATTPPTSLVGRYRAGATAAGPHLPGRRITVARSSYRCVYRRMPFVSTPDFRVVARGALGSAVEDALGRPRCSRWCLGVSGGTTLGESAETIHRRRFPAPKVPPHCRNSAATGPFRLY